MRYESKDFIKAHRQWHESRESKNKTEGNLSRAYIIQEEKGNKNSYICGRDKRITCVDRRNGINNYCPKEKAGTDFNDNNDRDDTESSQIEVQGKNFQNPSSQNSSRPADFSKKELEQLVRMKQKRVQQQRDLSLEAQTTMLPLQYEECTENFRRNCTETLISARNRVKRSNREKGSESSSELDGLLFSILPAHIWFGDFLSDSHGAFKKVQKRMLLDYISEYV